MPIGLQGQIASTRQQATAQDKYNYATMKDWRVILRLADDATYLYKSSNPGILSPLKKSDGVIFPYTPQIQVQYSANYDASDVTHSNYKIYQYRSSAVDTVSITCEFTAQDVYEANYLLSVVHFFKSVTKMFYGKDEDPKNGTPPPLCYLYGLGAFQFSKHPIAITGFNYQLPNDVDYIRASATLDGSEDGTGGEGDDESPTNSRTAASGISPGGGPLPPQWGTNGAVPGTVEPTYVPTKMQIQIQAIPIISRMDISSNFSLRDYASGKLLQGKNRGNQGGGIW